MHKREQSAKHMHCIGPSWKPRLVHYKHFNTLVMIKLSPVLLLALQAPREARRAARAGRAARAAQARRMHTACTPPRRAGALRREPLCRQRQVRRVTWYPFRRSQVLYVGVSSVIWYPFQAVRGFGSHSMWRQADTRGCKQT